MIIKATITLLVLFFMSLALYFTWHKDSELKEYKTFEPDNLIAIGHYSTELNDETFENGQHSGNAIGYRTLKNVPTGEKRTMFIDEQLK